MLGYRGWVLEVEKWLVVGSVILSEVLTESKDLKRLVVEFEWLVENSFANI